MTYPIDTNRYSAFDPANPATLVDLLRWRAEHQPEHHAYTFLHDGESTEATLSYAEVDRRARTIAARLQQCAVPGARVLLLYPPGVEYICAFFGCLYAGLIAVPAYPPQSARLERSLPRLRSIVTDCAPSVALTTAALGDRLVPALTGDADFQALTWLATDRAPETVAEIWREPPLVAETLAFLQYTSGSTAAPKGVMVSHGNLLHNQRLIQQGFAHDQRAIVVGWLPLYHDMGLIGNVLQPLYLGAHCVLMSPLAFLQSPIRWLQAISRFRAKTSGGPNFAYDLCVRKITPEQIATLDLSSWRVAFNGAEPVRAETLERFAATFAACGFRREAFYPCYGLAETTLIVAGGQQSAPPVVRSFAGDELEHKRVVEVGAEQPGARSLVGCGQVLGDQRVVVVEPETRSEAQPGTIGEIWVAGPSVALGYWNRPEATEQTFGARLHNGDGPFLRTGDLGFFHDGELFIAGRLKDLIIIRGRNYYPQDIELAVERSHAALRPNAGAAFAVESAGEERLVIVQEIERQHRTADLGAVVATIRQAIAEQHELQAWAILLLKPGSLPKTSSGKIQRHLCRSRFLAGEFEALHQSTLDSGLDHAESTLDRDALLAAAPDRRQPLIAAYLRDLLSQTLGVAPSALVAEQPLSSFGIDSLAAVELQHRIERDLGVPIEMVQLLQGLSSAELARQIGERLMSEAAPLQPVDRGGPLPLSFAQQRMWLLEQLTPGTATYTIPVVLRLIGALDPSALEQSLIALVRRHESLRTTFDEHDGSPVQIVAPPADAPALVSLPIVDLQAVPEQTAEIERLAIVEFRRPFDLQRGPLLRTTLLQLGSTEHLLLITLHHSIADGWSMNVFVRDLAALYEAAITQTPATLPDLPIQYPDFAVWQRAWLSNAILEDQLSYWRQQFDGDLPVLDLPTDRPRPAIQTFRGGRELLTLPAELTGALKALSQQHNATLFMTLLAGFKLLLARYSGQRDIVVGTPLAGRSRAQLEQVIGCFVNTLALRTDLAGALSFEALLARVREVCLGAYAHGDLPFEMLLDALNLERDPSRSPLFQVFFNMLVVPDRQIERGGLSFDMVSQPEAAIDAKFDITIYIQQRDAILDLELVYNADLFAAARMAELLRQFQHLLAQIVAQPAAPIDQFSLVTTTARVLLPDPQTPLPVTWSGAVHERFRQQARQTPAAIALLDEQETWSYAELDEWSDRLAARLSAEDIGRGECVAIYAQRSAALVWALLGALKAGAAFTILDSAYPTARLIECLRIAQPRGWIHIAAAGAVPEALSESLDRLGLRCRLTLGSRDAAQDLFAEAEATPAVTVSPDDLAYIAFTSGSTGAPKAILGSHRPLSHFLDWQTRTFALSAADRFSLLSGLAHDPLLRDVFTPLSIGATLCIPTPDLLDEPGQLVRWFAETCISVAHLTPAHSQLLTAAISETASAAPALATLRYAFFGGDRLTWHDVARFQALAPQAICVNCYGATETPQIMGYCVVDPAESHSSAAIPLGRGIDAVQLLVLNPAGQLAGVGELGEIAIRTPYLALGYLADEALTASRFIANPFVAATSQLDRIYRTGDLGRYLPDGAVTFAGRVDQQVKIRGFRVELGEIKAALRQHPDVREAVVVARETAMGDTRIVAYVVAKEQGNKETREQREHGEPRTKNLEPGDEGRESQAPDPPPSPTAVGEGGAGGEGLTSFLQPCLPSYMLPSAIVWLDRLPLTPNGKLDRRALPEPDANQLVETTHVPPRTPTEEIIAAIWAELLDRAAVGVHDNFFSLGGHSLLAARLMARLRSALDVELPLRTLFDAPTVAQLAQRIERRRGEATATEIVLPSVAIDPARRYEPFPLTDIQQAYWIGRSQAFELGNVATHTYLELEAIALDLPRFNRAWQRLIERHEMLRAIVRADGTQQILAEVPAYQIEALDLRDQDSGAQTAAIATIRERMSHQMLPSDRWPLFEIRATRLDSQRTRLHISMDALVSDAWSRQILARELSQLYEQPDAALPELELSFRDYVLAESALHQTELYRRALDYWRERLPTLPPGPDLPLAQSPSALDQPRFVRRSSWLKPDDWRRLRARAARSGLTPSGVLLAAFAEVLATWSKHPRFTINLTLFNRLPLHPQVDAIMGDFTSVTLLAVDLGGRDPFAVRAQRLQAQLWDDLDHRYVSGVRVLRELARSQDGLPKATMPVVFTSTLIQGAAGQGLAAINRIGEIAYSISQTPQVWLDHQVFEQGGALVFNWDAVEDLFPAGLLDAMFDAYCALLDRLVADETTWQQPLSDLIPTEQLAQRAAINATDAPISHELLHTLFLHQARQQPQQPAVITMTRSLSYSDLQRRATELGHWLRENGVRPNTLVAVVMEKGWEQVVAVLGVEMAGAAYLPIDPSLPTERLHYLLDHGQVTLALTQSWLDAHLVWPERIQRLCVDTLELSARAEQPLEPVQQPTDLAYVIYTSGSTGLPKGVMIDHRGAVNTILDLNGRFGVGPQDRVLALSSLSFDLSVYDIFGLLAAGGTIVMPDATALRDPRHWAQLLSRERVTIWNSVPVLMEMFVEYVAERPALHPEALRLVMMSGDWIPITLPERIATLNQGIAIWSLGGATEASIWSILYPIERVDPAWRSVPYGKPMLNQQFQVLGESFAPSPVWVPGQLYIGGIGLAQGYWRDPEKTAGSFVTHPRTGERLYRTGDLGRYLPDGNIEFLGREDFQLKIQGYRIELGEIESALSQHRLVRNAIVTAVGERQGSKRLVAYVVPEREAEAQAAPPARLLNPPERLQFKRRQPGLRHEPERLTIPLLRPELDDAAIEAAYIRRRSYRHFLASPVPFEQFSLLLSSLAQLAIPGAPAPKYRYSSAGSLYPVQIYLHIKPDRVAGLSAGAYYYDPAAHQLVLLTPDAPIAHDVHGPANRALFDDAAFSIFLVAQLSAITPMYSADSLRFATLEAGVITQLLESAAPELEIGLCQTGTIDFESIRQLFALETSHVWLHGLVGGAIDPAQMRLPAFLTDAESYHALAALVDRQEPADAPSYAPLPAPAPQPDAEIAGTLWVELRAFLKTKLPAYMVPSAFVLLDALPLSANGKVDRKALPSPDMTSGEQAEGFVAPQSQVEQTIASLLQEVLGLSQVGVNDNFFDLGGNSIHLVQVHSKLQTAFKVEVPLVEMFKHPTIRALANYLSQDLIPPAPPAAPEPTVDRGKQRLSQMLKRSSR